MLQLSAIGQWIGIVGFSLIHSPASDDKLKPVPIRDGVVALSPDTSRIEFLGTHVGPTPDPNARLGHFGNFAGRIGVDVGKGTLTEVVVEVDVLSISTFNPNLTKHLLAPDFFKSEEYPGAKFTSSEIRPGEAAGEAVVVGVLDMMGTKASIEIPVKFSLDDQGLTLTGAITLRRSQHGMDKMLERVNDEVPLKVFIGRPTNPEPRR